MSLACMFNKLLFFHNSFGKAWTRVLQIIITFNWYGKQMAIVPISILGQYLPQDKSILLAINLVMSKASYMITEVC